MIHTKYYQSWDGQSCNLLNSCKTFVGQLLARGINFFHKNEKFKKNWNLHISFIKSYKAPANTLCSDHWHCVIHIHTGSPILSHQLGVIRRVSLWLLDWTLLTDWLPTKSFHTGYRCSCWFISISSSGINGSVTSWLLPGSHPPTSQRRMSNIGSILGFSTFEDLQMTF